MILLIESAKSDFLLEAPLEILHEESQEWLDEVEFWKDEIAFFYALIVGKTRKSTAVLKTKEGKSIENHLVYVSAETLNDLKLEVQTHERFLSRLMDDVTLSEQTYRSKHKAIAKKIHDFENEFREMKKKVFQLAKKATPQLKIVNLKHKA